MSSLKPIFDAASHGLTFAPDDLTDGEKAQRLRHYHHIKDKVAEPTAACLFSQRPPVTIREAFHSISRHLPLNAGISFFRADPPAEKNIVFTWIRPRHGDDRATFTYRLFPECRSVFIRHMNAGLLPKQGFGSAMFLSQLPFWDQMGVRQIALTSLRPSRSFYEKLGFTEVNHLEECPNTYYLPMRLDLDNPKQKEAFFSTLRKPLTRDNPALQLRGISLS